MNSPYGIFSPGAFIRQCREAPRALSREDLALALDSDPPVSHRARVELIEQIEADLVPVSVSTAVALASVLNIDLERLAALVDAWPGDRRIAPRLRRAGARAPLFIGLGGEADA